ncbi:hypothetical protein K0M31_002236, partial [Melipona bicolor]
ERTAFEKVCGGTLKFDSPALGSAKANGNIWESRLHLRDTPPLIRKNTLVVITLEKITFKSAFKTSTKAIRSSSYSSTKPLPPIGPWGTLLL